MQPEKQIWETELVTHTSTQILSVSEANKVDPVHKHHDMKAEKKHEGIAPHI